jgi:hypothetical protein
MTQREAQPSSSPSSSSSEPNLMTQPSDQVAARAISKSQKSHSLTPRETRPASSPSSSSEEHSPSTPPSEQVAAKSAAELKQLVEQVARQASERAAKEFLARLGLSENQKNAQQQVGSPPMELTLRSSARRSTTRWRARTFK